MDRDWNEWDDSPRTVTEHIEQYRQKLVQPKLEEKQEPAIDFFQVSILKMLFSLNQKKNHIFNKISFSYAFCFLQDMAPNVIKQKKVFINTNKNANVNFSRLQATSAAAIPRLQTAELEDWSDEENDNGETGWEEVNDAMTKEMIREKRREARAQRHQRLQQQKLQQQQQQQSFHAYTPA